MFSCLDIAQYFIAKAYEDGRGHSITNMKVQKLLYYTQSLHLALFDQALFPDEIQAWRYGPVCPRAYHFYSDFEAKQLPIPPKANLTEISTETIELLEEVWDYFGVHNAYTLSDMTHAEFPWKKARNQLPADAASRAPILLEDMKLLGEQKLDEIERQHPLYQIILSQALKEAFEDEPVSPQFIEADGIHDWIASILA
jgi:uncharacterized phage-associated protein